MMAPEVAPVPEKHATTLHRPMLIKEEITDTILAVKQAPEPQPEVTGNLVEVTVTQDGELIPINPNQKLTFSKPLKPKRRGRYSCAICLASFSDQKSTLAHIRGHSGNRKAPHAELACDDCGAISFDRRGFEAHRQTHTVQASYLEHSYICHLCDRSFTQQGYLQIHLAAHEREAEDQLGSRAPPKTAQRLNRIKSKFSPRKIKTITQQNKTVKSQLPKPQPTSAKSPKIWLNPKEITLPFVQQASRPSAPKLNVISIKEKLKRKVVSAPKPNIPVKSTIPVKSAISIKSEIPTPTTGKPKRYQCSICFASFSSPEPTLEHIRNHYGRPKSAVHRCDECGKVVSCPSELASHKRVHHRREVATCGMASVIYACTHCFKVFPLEAGLMEHVETHQSEVVIKSERDSEVTEISPAKVAVDDDEADSMILEDEPKDKTAEPTDVQVPPDQEISCPICLERLSGLKPLSEHLKTHSRSLRRLFPCTLCPVTFSYEPALASHMELHQEVDAIKWTCETCGAVYRKETTLAKHITTVHPEMVTKRIKLEDDDDDNKEESLKEVSDLKSG